jgi:MtN3 and saliva related transmembrane protein
MQSILAVAATSWGLLMSLAPLLQVRVIVRQRDSSAISISWLTILLTGFILWLCYGAAIDSLPLVLTNVVSCVACTTTLAVVLRFRKGITAGTT